MAFFTWRKLVVSSKYRDNSIIEFKWCWTWDVSPSLRKSSPHGCQFVQFFGFNMYNKLFRGVFRRFFDLKNISQIGSFPQAGVKIWNFWNHHPKDIFVLLNSFHQILISHPSQVKTPLSWNMKSFFRHQSHAGLRNHVIFSSSKHIV